MRRAAFAATASGLTVLALLAGVHWTSGRNAVPVARWRAPATAATPAAPATARSASAVTPAPVSVSPTRASSPTRGTAPTPPTAGKLDLQRRTGTEEVALTFDDGPHPVWTPKILEALRAARVHATFCLIGTEAARYPALVARIVREGHTLCNHSWHHEFDLGTLPEAKIRANLERTNRAIRDAVPGARINYFRHPGGKWTPAAIKVARNLGMTSLHWSVDPQDWAKPGTAVIAKRVIDKARPGAVILLHDGGGDRSGTLGACSDILPALKRKYGIVLLK